MILLLWNNNTFYRNTELFDLISPLNNMIIYYWLMSTASLIIFNINFYKNYS